MRTSIEPSGPDTMVPIQHISQRTLGMYAMKFIHHEILPCVRDWIISYPLLEKTGALMEKSVCHDRDPTTRID